MGNGTIEPKINRITVTYDKFKKIAAAIETLDLDDNSEISFEFIVGSLFPNITENIKKEIKTQYTKGYIEGMATAKEEK